MNSRPASVSALPERRPAGGCKRSSSATGKTGPDRGKWLLAFLPPYTWTTIQPDFFASHPPKQCLRPAFRLAACRECATWRARRSPYSRRADRHELPVFNTTSGHIHDGTPKGTEQTIAGLPTYVASPKDGSKDKTVIFITDICQCLTETWAQQGHG